jgi:hypothetical protein
MIERCHRDDGGSCPDIVAAFEIYAACKQGEEHLHFRECQVHT